MADTEHHQWMIVENVMYALLGISMMEWIYYFVATVATAFPFYRYLVKRIERAERGQKTTWRGIVGRGFLEAEREGHLFDVAGQTQCSRMAREVYRHIEPDLKSTYHQTKDRIGREPSPDELAWEIEQRFQDWMISRACPALKLNQHGCIAIAYIIAIESPVVLKEP